MAFWTVLIQQKLRYTNIPAISRFNNGPCIVIYDCLRLRYFQISELNESSGCHLSDRFVFYGNPSIIKSDWQMKDIFKLNNLSHSVHPNKQTNNNKTHHRVFSFSIEFPFQTHHRLLVWACHVELKYPLQHQLCNV